MTMRQMRPYCITKKRVFYTCREQDSIHAVGGSCFGGNCTGAYLHHGIAPSPVVMPPHGQLTTLHGMSAGFHPEAGTMCHIIRLRFELIPYRKIIFIIGILVLLFRYWKVC